MGEKMIKYGVVVEPKKVEEELPKKEGTDSEANEEKIKESKND